MKLDPMANEQLRNWLIERDLSEIYQEIYDAFYASPSSAKDRQEVFIYLGWRIFMMFMLMSVISSSEQIAKEMIA